MDRAAGPRPPQIGDGAAGIEEVRDLTLDFAFIDEQAVDLAHGRHLLGWSWHQHDPVGLQALQLTVCKHALCLALLIDQHAAQPVTRVPTLAVAQLDQSTLSREDLR
jgi:hypothetical protein